MPSYFPSQNSIKLPNYFTVTADFISVTWNTVASHEIATVTGMVHIIVIPQCTETLTDSVTDLAAMQLGVETSTAVLIGSVGVAGLGGNTLSTNELWLDTSPADIVAIRTQLDALDFVVSNGLDVGYQVTGEALTDGTIIFHVWWEGLDSTGSVSAGAGGSL